MGRKLLIFLVALPLCATTYYVRVDGTVTSANKANATSCASADSALNLAQANAATFAAGSIVDGCSNTYRATLTPHDSGTDGNQVTYQNFTVKASDIVSTWTTYSGSTYQADFTKAATPLYVFVDGVLLAKGSGQDALNDHEWFWATNVLYYRDDSGDPDVLGLVIEASARTYAVDAVSKSYITLDHLDLRHAESFAVRHTTASGLLWNDVSIYDSNSFGSLSGSVGSIRNSRFDNNYAGSVSVSGASAATISISNSIFTNCRAACITSGSSNASTTMSVSNSTFDQWAAYPIDASGSNTVNVTSSLFTGASKATAAAAPIRRSGSAVVNVSYSNVLPDGRAGGVFNGAVTEGVGILHRDPWITSSAYTGFLALTVDDYPNMCSWRHLNALTEQYGVYNTLAVSNTHRISSALSGSSYCYAETGQSDLALLQAEVDKGHELAGHTRSHASLTTTSCCSIQYVGAGSEATATIADGIFSTSITGAADDISIDISTYQNTQLTPDPETDFCAAVAASGGGGKYTCSVTNVYNHGVPPIYIAEVSGQDIRTAPYVFGYDQTAWYEYEITGSFTDLQSTFTALGGGAYTPVSFNYPLGDYDATVITKTIDAGYLGARTTSSQLENNWILSGGVNLYTLDDLGSSSIAVPFSQSYWLAFENNCSDGWVGGNDFTCSNVTYSSTHRTGNSSSNTKSASFNGATSYATKATAAYADIHRGDFILGHWIKPSSITGNHTVWFQSSDDTHYIWEYITSAGALTLTVVNGTDNMTVATQPGAIDTAKFYQTEIVAHGGTYQIWVDGVKAAETYSTVRPNVYTGAIFMGCSYFSATAGNYYAGLIDDATMAHETYIKTQGLLSTLAQNGGAIQLLSHGDDAMPIFIWRVIMDAIKDSRARVTVTTEGGIITALRANGTLGVDGQTLTWAQPDQGNLRPRMGSPLCGRGTTPATATDLDGLPRLTNDIGPYRCVPKVAFGGVI